ncbi:protein DpdG [Streptomyces polygonati]|uniref:Protein DpdG n=1 Tax=Streptomyces polygonati TaxID=1617087 RepID=A0ABV8HRD1_9ACTN
MALINVGSRPAPMWAVVRFLAYSGSAVPLERARALLSPPTLAGESQSLSDMFDKAIKTLQELELLNITDDGALMLAGAAAGLDGIDSNAFAAVLRTTALARKHNNGLADTDEQTGARDLTRALSWFLSLDPMGPAIDWDQAQNLRQNALKPEAGPAIVNQERWQPFGDWSQALGLAARPLLQTRGASPLTPDCTIAIRQVMQELWRPGQQVNAVEAVRTLRQHLPVLPGGEYSRSLMINDPGERVAGAALSYALLRGHDEQWLRLELDSDAARVLQVTDPEQPSSPRYASDITILEPARA